MDVRTFIKNLGDDAPAFFDVKPETVRRWIKTGNVPIKAANKIFVAMNAATRQSSQQFVTTEQPEAISTTTEMDPMTNLPRNIDRRLPAVQFQGALPSEIEINPAEQSFGNNLTRPGRVPTAKPLPPMKLRDDGGQRVAYVENTPALAERRDKDGNLIKPVLPPTIAQDDSWAAKGNPIPAPKNESRTAQAPSKAISTT